MFGITFPLPSMLRKERRYIQLVNQDDQKNIFISDHFKKLNSYNQGKGT